MEIHVRLDRLRTEKSMGGGRYPQIVKGGLKELDSSVVNK